ncbi:MBL fold metallo-hydrolase [Roseibium salinum]|uniref:MBL fold metallo-hydrolase n=1 Tax=Roseibium salinum TaxID=1604349 RepID=A0ABT3R351_9HYPH|nr:MBL fold metallo-hydrolase [Roseibium sp. DSM 29163]MCX2723681.1 MBL fold metallo-hydrolase [Roseibium sp. DSM 29163]
MKHDRDFDPTYGTAVELLPGLRRLTAHNPGPFTFFGTNTYLLGTDRLVVVDPGPALPDHIGDIVKAAGGARIEAILVSHTHVDHSPGARLLKEQTGAAIVGCGIHRAARELLEDEINPLDASGDKDYLPDRELRDGEVLQAAGLSLETIETPGHTANHLCFVLQGEDVLLSADHVMGWSTSIVAPPDGSMRDYMVSIDKLLDRPEQTYFPGHGGVLRNALAYVGELKRHRLNREASILEELAAGPATIAQIVARLYVEVDPALHPAAALSVFAHLEDLAARGLVSAAPGLSLTAEFRLERRTD